MRPPSTAPLNGRLPSMLRTLYTAAAALLLALPLPAGAQWSPSATLDLGMGYGRMALSQAALNSARRMSEQSSEAFEEGGSSDGWAGPTFVASFQPDPDVVETVQQRFILFYGGDDPDHQAVMAQEVDSGVYHRRFRELMESHGLEPRLDDLVEVSAARFVVLWEIIHGQEVNPAAARAVREQLSAQYADDFWMKRMEDAEKQELSETFALHVAAAEIAYAEVVKRDDPDLLRHYRAGIQHSLLPDGPQLDRLTITDSGFEPL